jgi:hypothetical protein
MPAGKTVSIIAVTPKPPYYAVIFTSHRTDGDNGYGDMATKMVELAALQPGYLGIESAREENKVPSMLVESLQILN